MQSVSLPRHLTQRSFLWCSGTTQLLALIGFLCSEAEALDREGLSPLIIAQGFAEAAARCIATADDLAVSAEQLLDAGAHPMGKHFVCALSY